MGFSLFTGDQVMTLVGRMARPTVGVKNRTGHAYADQSAPSAFNAATASAL